MSETNQYRINIGSGLKTTENMLSDKDNWMHWLKTLIKVKYIGLLTFFTNRATLKLKRKGVSRAVRFGGKNN